MLLIAPSADIRYPGDHLHLDTSLRMSLGGDWMVPRGPDGGVHLGGPVFSYWPAALSFKALGPSMLTARLPFVLAGALTIWLIAWFGARLADRESGRLAAMCLAACWPWMLAGIRTLPEVWPTFFMTLAAGAFLLLLNGTHRRSAPWLAWIGLGLALATGGPVALMVLPALAVVWWRWRGDAVWRELFHRPAVLAGVGLGMIWYAVVVIRLGPSVLLQGATDPLAGVATAREAFDQGLSYLTFLPAALLPFSLLALGLRPDDWKWLTRDPGRRAATGYTLVLAAGLVAVFSLAGPLADGNSLMPALPWLALVLGILFRSAIAAGRPRRWLAALTAGLVGGIVLVLVFGVAALAVLVGRMEGHESLIWRVTVTSLVAVAVLLAAHGGPRRALVVPALMVLALPPVLFGVARPALPETARHVAIALEKANAPRPWLMAGDEPLSGVVRLMTGGRVEPIRAREPLPGPGHFGALVIPAGRLSDDGTYIGCQRQEIAEGFQGIRIRKLMSAVRAEAGAGEAYLAQHRQSHVLITCPLLPTNPTRSEAGT